MCLVTDRCKRPIYNTFVFVFREYHIYHKRENANIFYGSLLLSFGNIFQIYLYLKMMPKSLITTGKSEHMSYKNVKISELKVTCLLLYYFQCRRYECTIYVHVMCCIKYHWLTCSGNPLQHCSSYNEPCHHITKMHQLAFMLHAQHITICPIWLNLKSFH